MENQKEFQKPEKTDNRNNRTTLLIVLIALLVGANIYLYVKYNQKEKETVILREAVNVDSMRIVDLDAKYNTALVELESMKGQNATLDSILNVKEAEIKTMKASLDKARKDKKISDNEYQKQLASLQQLIEDLKIQITSLEKEKGILVQQKDSIGNKLNTQIDENGKLKTDLRVQTKKAMIGALLEPSNIITTGVYGRGSKNKEKTTTTAKKTESIRVTFDVPEKRTADPGTKIFLLRIVSPEGVTMAVQSQGSGVFELENGEKMQYTTKQDIDYNQQKQTVSMYWKGAAGAFAKGKYSVELYQDGYKIGTSTLTLK
jgi:hypothetical protein